ncbi:MAG: glycosyltransferase family 4 protein [Acidimicrobiales bacterium]
MILTFLAPSTRHPVGGNATIYEFATVMAQRGHEVHLYHHDLWGDDAVRSVGEIGWYEFRAELHHHFRGTPELDAGGIVSADVFFGYGKEVEENPRYGLPVSWVQGFQMYAESVELATYRNPCPKICVASWLTRIGREHGVPAEQLVHIPNGLRHDRHRLTRPIAGRPSRVLFCYNSHRSKGAALALEVLTALHARRPDVEIVGFGSLPPEDPLPDWITYFEDPDQTTLVDELFNGSAVFLWTSRIEGFGLPALEAMACGAALVTTDNGGSEDYAFPGESALVADYPDGPGLVTAVERLLDDDAMRVALATTGQRVAAGFTWEASGDRLETFLDAYLAEPQKYGRPG